MMAGLALAAVAGCSGTSAHAPSQPKAAARSASATADTRPQIQVSDFRPAGYKGNIYVAFQVTNVTPSDFRLQWRSLVLTAPDGSRHTPVVRNPSGAGYDLVAPSNVAVETAYFDLAKYLPGTYRLTYGDWTLASKSL